SIPTCRNSQACRRGEAAVFGVSKSRHRHGRTVPNVIPGAMLRSAHRAAPVASPMTAKGLSLGVAGPGADHAFLAAVFVAFARGGIERGRDLRLDGIAIGTARVGHIDRHRRAGTLHGHGRAVALALLL